MPETGLFRVLDSPHDDAWLFVPVGGGGDAAAQSPPSDERPAHEDSADATEDGDPATPTPGVPDAGTSEPASDDETVATTAGGGRHSYDPVAVPRSGHGDLDTAVAELRPGYLVRATLSWADPEPRVRELSVVKRTLFAFADDVVDMFEVAEAAWTEAAATGEAMASRVTRGTDGAVNGVLYVFADADGGDRLAEFRSGRRPLEPLLERVNDAAPAAADRADPWDPDDDAPSVSVGPGGIHVTGGNRDEPAPDHGLGHDREVFVLRPADAPYVAVLVTLRKGGTLANTVRDTYNCPRPEE